MIKFVRGKPISTRCRSCYRATLKLEGNPSWKGGKFQNETGYIQIKLSSDDFFYPMTGKRGYILEHRLVMAKHLGRLLEKNEVVHHINGIKNDNRLENLKIVINITAGYAVI